MADQLNSRQFCQICFGNEISAFLRPRLSREDFYHLKMLTIAFGIPLSVTKIEHNCVLSPNQQFATIQKVPQPVASNSRAPLANSTLPLAKSLPKQQQQPPASTSRAPLAHSTLPMAKSPPKQQQQPPASTSGGPLAHSTPIAKSPPEQQQQPPAPKMGKIRMKVIHENGEHKNIAITSPVGTPLNLQGVLMQIANSAFPYTPQMPFKSYKAPPGSNVDFVVLIGDIALVEPSQEDKEE